MLGNKQKTKLYCEYNLALNMLISLNKKNIYDLAMDTNPVRS